MRSQTLNYMEFVFDQFVQSNNISYSVKLQFYRLLKVFSVFYQEALFFLIKSDQDEYRRVKTIQENILKIIGGFDHFSKKILHRKREKHNTSINSNKLKQENASLKLQLQELSEKTKQYQTTIAQKDKEIKELNKMIVLLNTNCQQTMLVNSITTNPSSDTKNINSENEQKVNGKDKKIHGLSLRIALKEKKIQETKTTLRTKNKEIQQKDKQLEVLTKLWQQNQKLFASKLMPLGVNLTSLNNNNNDIYKPLEINEYLPGPE